MFQSFRRYVTQQLGLRKSVAIYYWKPGNRRRLVRFYSQFISKGDLCFDIGAHVGNRTAAWLELGARVVAVEPQPVCVRYLRKRFSGQNAEIVPAMIGDRAGTGTLYISSANPTISTASDQKWRDQLKADAHYAIQWDEELLAPVVTLDMLIAQFGTPQFCKLDVENSEYEALSGLTKPLLQLSFEYYPPAMSKSFLCLQKIESLGEYEYNLSIGETQRLASEKWVGVEKIKNTLRGFSSRYEYGDIYARLKS